MAGSRRATGTWGPISAQRVEALAPLVVSMAASGQKISPRGQGGASVGGARRLALRRCPDFGGVVVGVSLHRGPTCRVVCSKNRKVLFFTRLRFLSLTSKFDVFGEVFEFNLQRFGWVRTSNPLTVYKLVTRNEGERFSKKRNEGEHLCMVLDPV